MGLEALSADGVLDSRYHDTPIGQKYLRLAALTEGSSDRSAIEARVFNHLIDFFSRYYQGGDFVPRYRASRQPKYFVPYNGEEIHLHWANSGQYYVKTAEFFGDYTFTCQGVSFRFRTVDANVEQDNAQGNQRFFWPVLNAICWDERVGLATVPFEYRPASGEEAKSFRQRNRQEAINRNALQAIPACLEGVDCAIAALRAERHRGSDNIPVSCLEYHLRQFTRRNTSDFFIHKNLGGFLNRELDSYLKNEVLRIDELEKAGPELADGWFQTMRVIKSVGMRIIKFLDQFQRFQKLLWEKRKFVVETRYCIAVGIVDTHFYPQIAACEAQWQEWQRLLHIDAEQDNLFHVDGDKLTKRVDFLQDHPTLVLDTCHFTSAFTDELIGSYNDLDGITDGLLIHSENFQALALLREKFREQIKCIHIDPPYNTNSRGFLYKNDYRHSSWLSMMHDRIVAAVPLMHPKGGLRLSHRRTRIRGFALALRPDRHTCCRQHHLGQEDSDVGGQGYCSPARIHPVAHLDRGIHAPASRKQAQDPEQG